MLHRREPDNISRQLNNFGALSGILWDNLVNTMSADIFNLCLDTNKIDFDSLQLSNDIMWIMNFVSCLID